MTDQKGSESAVGGVSNDAADSSAPRAKARSTTKKSTASTSAAKRSAKSAAPAKAEKNDSDEPKKAAVAKKAPAKKTTASKTSSSKSAAKSGTAKTAAKETSQPENLKNAQGSAPDSASGAVEKSTAQSGKKRAAPSAAKKSTTGSRSSSAKKKAAPTASSDTPTPTQISAADATAPATAATGDQVGKTADKTASPAKKKPAAKSASKSSSGTRKTAPGSKTAKSSVKKDTGAASGQVEDGASIDTFHETLSSAPGNLQEAVNADASEQAAQSPSAQKSREGDENKKRSRSRRGRGRKKDSNGLSDATDQVELAGQSLSESDLSGDASESEPETADDAADATQKASTRDNKSESQRKGSSKSRTEEEPAPGKQPRKKMFVSVLPEEQVEVVVTEEGQVQEYYVEMLNQAKTKGNIYKATVHNVDANLQAAFIAYGAAKNGFLQIDEVHPEYYLTPHDPTKGRKYPLIQKVLKPGQEVLVQVVKEPTGTKGAFLTTYLSLPGRFLVLTPGREQIGVSRKVDHDGERSRLRELLEGLNPGPGLGVIVRTVSMGVGKTHLQKDLQFLKRLWKEVRAKGTVEPAPSQIYQEMELSTRAVRDYLTDDITEVWLDDETTADSITEIATLLFPRKQNLVRLHKDAAMSLFERFNLRKQLDQIHSREVSLPSGGRLVIDPTEALTAIDINSGRSSGKNNFEDMAFRTNMEAAKMIPLQLRLRDIGGQIVADFIEMRDKNHWREVEKALRNGMKNDRARYDIGKIGPFGLLEIVRQRLGSSAISNSSEPCPHCKGTGIRRNMEWQSQQAMRELLRQSRAAQAQNQQTLVFEAEPCLAMHLLNHKRQRLAEIEQTFDLTIEIRFKQTI